MFRTDEDFAAFERVLEAAVVRSGDEVDLLAYVVMGNHWHLVLRTHCDGAMGQFMKWLTTTHSARYRVAHGQTGIGHLYQGRYKAFVIEQDRHLRTVCRYVERNAARAGLVPADEAEAWRWSSLHRWRFGDHEAKQVLSRWPGCTGTSQRPRHWLRTVNQPLSEKELEAIRLCGKRDRPFGTKDWLSREVKRHGLESTVRSPGRPKRDAG